MCCSTCLLSAKVAAVQDDDVFDIKCKAGKLNIQSETWLKTISQDLIGMQSGHIPGDDKLLI